MANRVAFGALPGGGHGLRVSKPGSNVLSTSLDPKDVSFDSRWLAAARIHMIGEVTVAASSSFPSYTTVNFGVTFSAPPPLWAFEYKNSELRGFFNWSDPGWFENFDPADYAHVRIYTNRVSFLRAGSSRVIKFIVMRPLG